MRSLKLTVVEEVAVLASVKLLCDESEQAIVEFELRAHLVPQVMDAVKKLEEYLGSVALIAGRVMTTPL